MKLANNIKKRMSVEFMDLEIPDISILNEARSIVASKQKQHFKKESYLMWMNPFFWKYTTRLSLGLSFIAIIYFSYLNTENYEALNQELNRNGSTNTSTVLASLTQNTISNTTVQSSTVLTSIITFVAKN